MFAHSRVKKPLAIAAAIVMISAATSAIATIGDTGIKKATGAGSDIVITSINAVKMMSSDVGGAAMAVNAVNNQASGNIVTAKEEAITVAVFMSRPDEATPGAIMLNSEERAIGNTANTEGDINAAFGAENANLVITAWQDSYMDNIGMIATITGDTVTIETLPDRTTDKAAHGMKTISVNPAVTLDEMVPRTGGINPENIDNEQAILGTTYPGIAAKDNTISDAWTQREDSPLTTNIAGTQPFGTANVDIQNPAKVAAINQRQPAETMNARAQDSPGGNAAASLVDLSTTIAMNTAGTRF